MTASYQSDSPTNRDEFETQLKQLITAANDDEIPIEGAYDVRSPKPDERDYQVEITEVAKSFGPARTAQTDRDRP